MNVKPITPVNTISKITQIERAPDGKAQQEVKKQNMQEEKRSEAVVTSEDVTALAEIMNKVSELYNHTLHFEVYEDTNRLYVQIVDRETKEVIKQIPPEEMLELSAKIQEMVGILLDKYV